MHIFRVTLLLIPGVLLAPLSTPAEEDSVPDDQQFERDAIRELTDRQGRKVRARITRLSLEEVWLQREDGQDFRVSIPTFSEEDQAFFELWRLADILNSEDEFGLSIGRFHEGSNQIETEVVDLREDHAGYRVTLRNRSPVSIRNLAVDYRIFKKLRVGTVDGEEEHLIFTEGTELIPLLPQQQSYEFRSETTALAESPLQEGLVYLEASSDRGRDELGGIWIRLRKDGFVLAEFSRPSDLMSKEDR